jgi:hypothetical protein
MQCFQTNGQKIFICYNFKMANLMFFSCKDNNQKSLDNLSGTWQVKQITFSQTGSINPDNISIIIFQLDNCRQPRADAGSYNKLLYSIAKRTASLRSKANVSSFSKKLDVDVDLAFQLLCLSLDSSSELLSLVFDCFIKPNNYY